MFVLLVRLIAIIGSTNITGKFLRSAHQLKAMKADLKDKITGFFETFRTLNPELVGMIENELYQIGPELGTDYFADAVAFGEELVGFYTESPVKRAEGEVLGEYYFFLDRASKQLQAAGDLPRENGSGHGSATTMALVPKEFYDASKWYTLTAKASVPRDIVHAVDALRRRNELVSSVIEPYFKFLLLLDRDKAFAWQLELCADQEKPIDPDVARDLIRVWRAETELPATAIECVEAWSSDVRALRHWPAVVEAADSLLRKQALLKWLAGQSGQTQQMRRLKFLAPFDDQDRLLRWLKQIIAGMGVSVNFFIQESEKNTGKDGTHADAEWRQNALFRELVWLEQMLTPMILLGDLILSAPDGAFDFAMSVFGFTQEYKKSWEGILEKQCREAIRRCFLTDLKRSRTPVETIKRLCFDDADFEQEILAELDIVTEDFDSMGQRAIAVEKLTAIYSSYREQPLLNTEIGRRYRRLMRVLHEDSLRRFLTAEQLQTVMNGMRGILLDLSMIASESRKFLSIRRSLDLTTEEILAAEMDYVQSVRVLRASYIHRLMHG